MHICLRFTLFVGLSVLLTSSALAQITLQSSDLTAIDDQIIRYGDTIPAYGPGAAGANVVWDFSAAIADTTSTTDVVAVSATPYASTFSNSDYAMTSTGSAFLYFTHNNATMTTTGAAGDLLGTGEMIEAPFTDALTLHQFPRTYGSAFDDTYAFQAEADGASFGVNRVRLTHTGHVFDTTDAYGTLITPTGTYQALRVKSTDYTTDVIEIKLFPFSPWTEFSTTNDTSVSYSWHAKEEMLAIAEFSYDTVGNPKQFTYSAVEPAVTVGLGDVDEEIPFSVYPQPAASQLTIKGLNVGAERYEAEVWSLDGKMMKRKVLSEPILQTSDLPAGMYFLTVRSVKKPQFYSLKIVVQ